MSFTYKKKLRPPHPAHFAARRLKMSGAGYGFVQTSEGEFFIPASKTADAFDGDVVEVARIHDGEREGRL